MSVLNRPLFRQAGGPAQPMPQDMMPPAGMEQQMAMLQQAEMQGQQQGQQIGAQYAQQMMQGVDQAETSEDLINALRGNQKPIDARYQELAQFVGPEDAQQTPESVLALVQPVIMMTEQGAIDSGIGELLQGLMGDTDMEGDMAGGVGSLMMAGAPEAPVPQNFNQGGPVQKFAPGGAVMMPPAFDPMMSEDMGSALFNQQADFSGDTYQAPRPTAQALPTTDQTVSEMLMAGGKGLRGYYDEMLPLYQELLGDTEKQKDYNKAQTYFDIAQAGLNLASGVDPRTGQNMAGRPLGSQLAAAATGIGPAMQQRAAEQRKLEMGIKSSALQGAVAQSQLDQKFTNDLLTAGMALRSKLASKGLDERVVLDSEGNEVAVLNVNNPTDFATYKEYQEKGGFTFKKLATGDAQDLTNYIIQDPEGKRKIVESFDGGRTYINEEGDAVPMPKGKGYSVARPGADEVAALQKSIGVQEKYRKILEDYRENGKITPSTGTFTNSNLIRSTFTTSALQNKDVIEKWTGEDLNVGEASKVINDAQEMAYQAAKEATGPIAALRSGLNNYIGFLSKMSPEDEKAEQQRAYLRAVRFIGKVALVSNSRFPVAEMALASELFPDPDKIFTDPEREAQKLQVIKDVTSKLYEHNLMELADGGLTPSQRSEAQSSLREIELLNQLLGDVPDFGEELSSESRFNLSGQRMQQRGYGTGVQ
jgi:hypothetical protein